MIAPRHVARLSHRRDTFSGGAVESCPELNPTYAIPALELAMLLFDGHLDLSMNAIEWNRDLTQSLEHVRRRESRMRDKIDRGRGVCTFPEMRRGEIGICIATQIARYVAPDNSLPGWHSPEIAWSITQAQLAWYRAMEEAGELIQITDRASLNRVVELWTSGTPSEKKPIGYILSLEGAGLDDFLGSR